MAAGVRTVAAVVALVGVPFVLAMLVATFLRAGVCVLVGAIAAGLMIAYIWVFESGGFLDLRAVLTVGVAALFGLWCVGALAGRAIRARRARLRQRDLLGGYVPA